MTIAIDLTKPPPKPMLSDADWACVKNVHDCLVGGAQQIIEVAHEQAEPMLFLFFEQEGQPNWGMSPLNPKQTAELFDRMKQGAVDEFTEQAFLNEHQFKEIGTLRCIVQLNEGWLSSSDDGINRKPAPEGYLGVTPHADGRVEVLMLLFRFPAGLFTVTHGIETLSPGRRKVVLQPFPTQDKATFVQTLTSRSRS